MGRGCGHTSGVQNCEPKGVFTWNVFTEWSAFAPFAGEVKTLMIQLLRAVHHLHDNWILHRDLKASNLLLSHKGILKVQLDH